MENHDRVVVHYYQPHAPFIGDVEMTSSDVGGWKAARRPANGPKNLGFSERREIV